MLDVVFCCFRERDDIINVNNTGFPLIPSEADVQRWLKRRGLVRFYSRHSRMVIQANMSCKFCLFSLLFSKGYFPETA